MSIAPVTVFAESAPSVPSNACVEADAIAAQEAELELLAVPDIVARAQAGSIALASLPQARIRCVAYLVTEGFSIADTALALGVGERTVSRDRALVRKAWALSPTLNLADELLGEVRQQMHASTTRLTRLAKDPEAPHYARVWAEELIDRIGHRFLASAEKLGYLRSAAPRVEYLRLTNEEEGVRERAKFQATIARLQQVVPVPEIDAATLASIMNAKPKPAARPAPTPK